MNNNENNGSIHHFKMNIPEYGAGAEIFMDGKDIGEIVTKASLTICAAEQTTVSLDIIASAAIDMVAKLRLSTVGTETVEGDLRAWMEQAVTETNSSFEVNSVYHPVALATRFIEILIENSAEVGAETTR